MFTGTFARVLQHVLDDGIGTLTVLHDFVEIAPQDVRQLSNFGTYFLVQWALQDALQFVDQLAGDSREIVDKVERVLDLVRYAGGELTERGKLLRLHQAVLRDAQLFQRLGQFARSGFHAFKKPNIFDCYGSLVGEGRRQVELLFSKGTDLLAS